MKCPFQCISCSPTLKFCPRHHDFILKLSSGWLPMTASLCLPWITLIFLSFSIFHFSSYSSLREKFVLLVLIFSLYILTLEYMYQQLILNCILRCHSHMIKFLLINMKLNEFCHIQSCTTTTTIYFQNISSSLCLQNNHVCTYYQSLPVSPYQQPLVTTNLLLVSVSLLIVDISYRQNHNM